MKPVHALLALVLLAACGPSHSSPGTSPAAAAAVPAAAPADSSKSTAGRPEQTWLLEDLLRIQNENELKQHFGAAHVTHDTIWGPEGSWYIGTILLQNSTNEVEIAWRDTISNAQMAFARVHGHYVNGTLRYDTQWRSSSGAQLGMTTAELERINGKAFSFSGFDWDYGGYVMSWEKGNLDNKGVLAQLVYGSNVTLSETEMKQVSGDQNVTSDNPVIKRILPQVYELTVNESAVRP